MRITVLIAGGDEKFASMEPDDTVFDLRRRVKKDMPAQWLETQDGNRLPDDMLLGDAGVKHGAVLVQKPDKRDNSRDSLADRRRDAAARVDRNMVNSTHGSLARGSALGTSQFNRISSDVKSIASQSMNPQRREREQRAARLAALEGQTSPKAKSPGTGPPPGSRRAQVLAEMEAERAKEEAEERAEMDRAVARGVNIGKITECMCGFSNFGWDAFLKHLDRMGPPHRVRRPGDDSPWDGPEEIVMERPKAGVNPGCTVEHMRLASQNRGKRLDLLFAGMLAEEPEQSPGGLGDIDLTNFDADAQGAPVARDPNKKGPKPPSEVLPGLLWQAGRKDCAEMAAIPQGCFTHSVYSLNESPCATPFACESSFFVDLADQLSAFIQPYFEPVCKYIDEAREKFGKRTRVVVHCQHGQSRSGALVVAYVMWSERWSLKQAVKHTLAQRPNLRMNVAFLSQLQAFEMDLYRKHSPSISLEELDKLNVCKCYYAFNDPSAGVKRGERNCKPWTPKE
eukprot:TRINITY_DN23399_c0_g1_i1.p1 TRINITY_DN23399_c0_g1~~TRINITY_DN23399_c0_g1_i1.p1  ORF type:complete len:510 (+),score=130.12 TRINITY_DN23399_c0_g1_i1:36-1565(+)